ncbi:MAG TPA: polyribonucleotide nucleotidyltransferase [Bacilli bacterium]|jgi:polyribonucleotide nucleotidyltransferase|nr:polyribonucleotide nucleotidyltransferase [Bacilli bacterium]HQC89783.1 polyribonucleotide nucleotidyltransferase [Bacilli bacterium]
MNEKRVFEYVQGDRKFIVEVGELAKQANGAALVRFEDTAVLSVAVMSKAPLDLDFFPLTVIYQEKLYAGGKIPGGFLRREGRPSEHETLSARLIDRPIRPLFAEGFRNDVQVINTVLSANPDNIAEVAAMLGSSLALTISDIPFNGPIAGVCVGRVDGELVINPTVEQLERSDINLFVAGTMDAINMVEASAKQVPEEDMLRAMLFAHEEIKRLVAFQNEIRKEVGKEKVEVELKTIPEDLAREVEELAKADLLQAVVIKEKLERYGKIDEINERVIAELTERYKDDEDLEQKIKFVKRKLEEIVAEEVRRLITEEKIRPDGRGLDEIRPLSSSVDVLVRPHGSALFTRGQTQALSAVTLGALGEYQIIDGLGVEEGKRFMFHYNFPPFSVGETGRYSYPSRREIGHGALSEKALLQVLPSEDEFPYTIRIVSEILESNGSSSQASICAGTLALMAAGVPIKAPIAGIAMGLITDGKNYTILTDIQGMEDHYGDMDFKVAGSATGITALQMDIKIAGIDEDILREALAQARSARLKVLEHMLETIPAPRSDVSQYAPKVISFFIDPMKIRDVIGSGGRIITDIINQCNDVKIDIENDGRVTIMHPDKMWAEKAARIIEDIVREVEVGEFYPGKVVRIEKFGAFVELWQNTEGLIHISKMAAEKVARVEDVLHLGDEIIVKVIGIDDKGRIDLATKDYVENRKKMPPRKKPPYGVKRKAPRQ